MDLRVVLVLALTVFQSCSGFHCPMPTGNYPMIESESCEVYWQCRNGMLVAGQCAGAHQFHYRERKCLHGSIVSCIMQREKYKQSHTPHKATPHKPMPMPMAPNPAPPKPVYIPFPVPVHPQHPLPPCAEPPCGKPTSVLGSPCGSPPCEKPIPGSPCGSPPCGKPVAGVPGLLPFPQKGQIPPYIDQLWRNVYGQG